jgi:hypothetical protein
MPNYSLNLRMFAKITRKTHVLSTLLDALDEKLRTPLFVAPNNGIWEQNGGTH